ncbi:MAG: N utilization substance protein B [Candidatus Azotimanducaceae bacterium]|jgi:N utilization substance protein B
MSKKTPAAKSRARRFALQALYQVQFAQGSAIEVEMQFRQDHDMKRVDTEFFHDLLSGIMHTRGDLEQDIEAILKQEDVVLTISPETEAVVSEAVVPLSTVPEVVSPESPWPSAAPPENEGENEGEGVKDGESTNENENVSEARSLKDLDPVAKAVLLIGTFELQNRIEIPYKVVLNESIELAKQFGAAESHRFVNQVLDKMARIKRKVEFDHEASRVKK